MNLLKPYSRNTATVALLAAVVTRSALSQSLVCTRPAGQVGECVLKSVAPGTQETIRVRLTDSLRFPVQFARVNFTSTAGSIRSVGITDENGEAVTEWTGEAGTIASIVASSIIGSTKITRTIVIKPEPTVVSRRLLPLHFPDLSRDTLKKADFWFVDRQLGHPFGVVITGADATTCGQQLVLFRQTNGGSGAVTPDSAYGHWGKVGRFADRNMYDRLPWHDMADSVACVAIGRWKPGKDIGEHYMRAGLVGDPRNAVEFRARMRALPRLIAGIGMTREPGRAETKTTDSTFKVTRVTASGSVVFDSVKRAVTLNQLSRQSVLTPTIGVDWPLKLSWPNIRTSVSVAIKNATTDWFVGLSVPQLVQGYVFEGAGIDLHAVLHVTRRSFVGDVNMCSSAPATCISSNHTQYSAGLMLTVDTALLGVITSAFGLK